VSPGSTPRSRDQACRRISRTLSLRSRRSRQGTCPSR
jgi:hypothetical protein